MEQAIRPLSGFRAFVRQLRAACRAAFAVEQAREGQLWQDIRLFSTTFAAGFLFVSLFLA